MIKPKSIIALVLLPLLLTGCSYYADLYLINKTEDDVSVTIELRSELEEVQKQDYQLQLKFAEEILEVNDETESKLSEKLEYETIDPNRIKIELPPKSTTLLGGGYNGLPKQFESFTIEKGEGTKTLSSEELESASKKTDGNSPPFHFTYVIE